MGLYDGLELTVRFLQVHKLGDATLSLLLGLQSLLLSLDELGDAFGDAV